MSFPYEFTFEFPETPVIPGAVVPGGARSLQFARGIKFANVPGGRADMVAYGGDGRVAHVNTVETVMNTPIKIEMNGNYSGAIKFRFRDHRNFPVPSKVRG